MLSFVQLKALDSKLDEDVGINSLGQGFYVFISFVFHVLNIRWKCGLYNAICIL